MNDKNSVKEEMRQILSMIHKARQKRDERERDFRGYADIGNISMEYRNPCKYYDIAYMFIYSFYLSFFEIRY